MFNFQIKNKEGFTLAEVLITLGIIGIVAALTLPTVIGHYRKKEASSRLKKFYSTMSQAILLSENDNGPSREWSKIYYITDEEGNYDNETNRNLVIAYFDKYLKPYLKYIEIEENPEDLQDEETAQSAQIRVHFADGSYMNIRNGACTDLSFDVNGKRNPNILGKDIFKFVICPKDKALVQCGGNKNWCAYCPECNTREAALQRCKTLGNYCGRLLMMDDWEFKEDYPYKL